MIPDIFPGDLNVYTTNWNIVLNYYPKYVPSKKYTNMRNYYYSREIKGVDILVYYICG